MQGLAIISHSRLMREISFFFVFLQFFAVESYWWVPCGVQYGCASSTEEANSVFQEECADKCRSKNQKFFEHAGPGQNSPCRCASTCTYISKSNYNVYVLTDGEYLNYNYINCGYDQWCGGCAYKGPYYSLQSCADTCAGYSHFFIAGNGDGHCNCCPGCTFSSNVDYDVYARFVWQPEYSAVPTRSPTPYPTRYPTLVPTRSPTAFPTSNPTSEPTSPSAEPTSEPTMICAHGKEYSVKQNKCILCSQGYYRDESNIECTKCLRGTTNVGEGNVECDAYVSGINLALPIIFCIVFGLLVVVGYIWCVMSGGNPWLGLTMLCILADQITDIIYATTGVFHSRDLMIAAGIFCIAPFAPIALYIFYQTKWTKIFASQKIVEFHKSFDSLEPIYKGWVAHAYFGYSWAKLCAFLPLGVAMLAFDTLWILGRIFLEFFFVVGAIFCQMLLFGVALLLHVTKLTADRRVHQSFWDMWNGGPSPVAVAAPHDPTNIIIPNEVNVLVIFENAFETIPQLTIQIYNNSLVYGNRWSGFAAFNLFCSLFLLVTVIWHFLFYAMKYKSWEKIPNLDFVEQLKISLSTDNPNQNQTPPTPPTPVPDQYNRVSTTDVVDVVVAAVDLSSAL